MHLIPAPAGHGIRFLRTDLHNGARLILPSAQAVSQTRLCTRLDNVEGGYVSTVEHLLAALHALGLTNLLIEIDGEEVPILDGSSQIFVKAIAEVGLVPQDRRQSYLRITRPVEVREGTRAVQLLPHQDPADTSLSLDFTIDFAAPCIGRQSWSMEVTSATFTDQVSAARTFGFHEEIENLRAKGLAKGGSFSNAIVIADGQVQNPEGLRFADEFVRHKALDAVGDLFIEGLPVIGRYVGTCAGHKMTNWAMRSLMADSDHFERVEI